LASVILNSDLTSNYAYDCWQTILGLSYNYSVGAHYSLSGDLSYQWMRSFRQRYTPRANPAETSQRQIDFAGMLVLSIGLNRDLGQRFLLSAQLLAPVYTRWRNDKIFKDDPKAFSKPRFSVGSAIGLAYYLREKKIASNESENETCFSFSLVFSCCRIWPSSICSSESFQNLFTNFLDLSMNQFIGETGRASRPLSTSSS
jgi:hypothetical protein